MSCMNDMLKLSNYVCNKFYSVLYKKYDQEVSTVGILLNYASGNIDLLSVDGIYHIRYSDIMFMGPIKNFPLDKCSEEFQDIVKWLTGNNINGGQSA